MNYDKDVLTITDILTALEKFDNKDEIVDAIKSSLYDIETDWHTEEMYRKEVSELQLTHDDYLTTFNKNVELQDKLDKIKKYVTEKLIYIDNCDDQETILSVIGGE